MHAAPARAATTFNVLFDDTSAETAGNADWIISTAMPDPLAQNPAPTTETSWTGALSAWGVALQRTGRYSLKTLPPTGAITFGNASNALDLSHFNEFVLPEPNVLFTAAEKTAIMQFVQAGGGLFMISDHNGSDRNNDGADSVKVLNDLMTNNSVDPTDPFGLSIDVLDISNENPSGIGSSAAGDPIIAGPFGAVTGTIIRDGTTATLHPADNSAARGEIYRSSFSTSGTTGIAFATSTFGSGRVAYWGDSSPMDDGTGQSGNNLFDGWDDPAGTDAALALNATEWLGRWHDDRRRWHRANRQRRLRERHDGMDVGGCRRRDYGPRARRIAFGRPVRGEQLRRHDQPVGGAAVGHLGAVDVLDVRHDAGDHALVRLPAGAGQWLDPCDAQ